MGNVPYMTEALSTRGFALWVLVFQSAAVATRIRVHSLACEQLACEAKAANYCCYARALGTAAVCDLTAADRAAGVPAGSLQVSGSWGFSCDLGCTRLPSCCVLQFRQLATRSNVPGCRLASLRSCSFTRTARSADLLRSFGLWPVPRKGSRTCAFLLRLQLNFCKCRVGRHDAVTRTCGYACKRVRKHSTWSRAGALHVCHALQSPTRTECTRFRQDSATLHARSLLE